MRIAYLAAQGSIHTVRWANALAKRGHEVHLLTIKHVRKCIDSRVNIHELPFPRPYGYYLNTFPVRRLLRHIRPDLLHAHYASGYGTLGRLSGFRPYILSVWGSDVFDFPTRSHRNRRVIIANLKAADRICSTSHTMAKHTERLASDIPLPTVTPFGIDIEQFRPEHGLRDERFITIGTLKTLSPKYGIDILIHAFALTRAKLQAQDPRLASRLRLLIIGGGPDRSSLENLAAEIGIMDATEFTGPVPHEEAAKYLNSMDIYVATSRKDSESFGVAVLEASACGVPVVVSDVGGLPEVVVNGSTGIVVPRQDVEETANALTHLILSPEIRASMGTNGRRHVVQNYSWEESVDKMEQVYREVLSSSRRQNV